MEEKVKSRFPLKTDEPPKDRKRSWPISVLEATRYRATVLSVLFNMNIGDVIDRALICYANHLRLAEKMQEQFPKQGIETPALTPRARRGRKPRLQAFTGHGDFFNNLDNYKKFWATPTDMNPDGKGSRGPS